MFLGKIGTFLLPVIYSGFQSIKSKALMVELGQKVCSRITMLSNVMGFG